MQPTFAGIDKSGETKSSLTSKMGVVFQVVAQPAVCNVLLFSLISGLGSSLYQSMFSVAAKEHFKLDVQSVGFFMSFGSILGVVANVLLVGPLVYRFGDVNVVSISCFIMSSSLVVFSTTSTYYQLMALQIPLALSGGVLYTTQSSLMSKVGDESTSGTRIALSHACRSTCGIIAPLLGGRIYDAYGFFGFGLCAALMVGLGALYMQIAGRRAHFTQLPEKTKTA